MSEKLVSRAVLLKKYKEEIMVALPLSAEQWKDAKPSLIISANELAKLEVKGEMDKINAKKTEIIKNYKIQFKIDEVLSQAVPAVAPKAVPAVAPKAVPAVAPKAVPAVAPKAVPAVAPKAVPAVAPKAVPAVASDELLDNSNTEEDNSNTEEENVDECQKLFDPCTKEPIASLELIEKRVRELKKKRNSVPVGLYGLSNNTTNYEFLNSVFINPEISIDDMVSFKLSEGRAKAGTDIFEVLARLFVFFGGIKDVNPTNGGNYRFMDRIEGGKRYNDTKQALQSMKCIASKGSGVSDITLVKFNESSKDVKPDAPYCEVECNIDKNIIDIKTYLMSVKWYKDEKNAEHYDLEKLYTISKSQITSAEQKPFGIIVFLKSKRDFEIAHNRSYRQYVREIANTFFGYEEDVKPFLEEIRRSIFELASLKNITPKEALESQYFIEGAKPILSLQLHQDIIVKGLCDSIEKNTNNLYLIGVLPRGGKTYIAGGIIREYLARTKIPKLNIFWLTAAPNETKPQIEEELLNKFQDFNNFDFIEVKTTSDLRKNKDHSVFFCSSQLLLQTQKTSASKKRDFLFDLVSGKDQLGLLFFDEAHKTGVGEQTKLQIEKLIETYSFYKLPFIFLTATYYNILFEYQIQKENTFIWDYTDVLSTRALATSDEQESSIINLENRFGKELVTNIVEKRKKNGETLETMAKAYIGFPDLYFISADFQEETINRFEEQNKYRPDSGFDLKSIFAIKETSTINDIKTSENKIRNDAYKIFVDIVNPRNMISLFTPKERFIEEGEGGEPLKKEEGFSLEPSLLARIDNISRDSQSRFRIDENPSLLMFMPTGGTGSNIFLLLCAWASLLMNHSWWNKRYEVVCVVDEKTLAPEEKSEINSLAQSNNSIHIINKNLKSNIFALERKLHCEKNKGLVILAGEKLSMGISLPCVDVVFLLNEKKSPDDIIQKMYRALTPSVGKKSAFVVDLNPVRTLAALYGYTRASHIDTNTTSELLGILYDTYSWDTDVFEFNLQKGQESNVLTFQDKLKQMFDLAENDKSGVYKLNEDIGGVEKKLAENIKKGIDPEFVAKLRGTFSNKKIQASLSRIGLKEGSKITLQSGKLVIRSARVEKNSNNENNDDNNNDNNNESPEIIIDNFIETVADFIKYLAVTSTKSNFEEALQEYESDIKNQEGSSLRRNILKLVRSRIELKGLDDDKLLSNILLSAVKDFARDSSERVFRQMKGKIDEKSLRKDKILAIINKRLTPRQKQKKELGEVFTPIELIEDMLSHLPKSDWSNPDLKWLDPANGIGNFPVVIFYKLDEGLKGWEPNENKRRKHIIENMIYMMEIQSNNNRIARNIFTSLCKSCTPNIWTIDTLKISNEKIKEHFHIDNFDRVIGNPPFQAFQEAQGKRGGGDELYMKFVKKSIELLKSDGFLVFVHPPSWRKPQFNEGRKKSKNAGMFDLMAHENQIVYLEIHDSKDGMKIFKAGTRYDFYVMKKALANVDTKIKDMHGYISDVDLRDFEFLPNFNIKNVLKLFPKKREDICELGKFNEETNKYENSPCILYERSAYGGDKAWVSQEETSQYKYPLVHATLKDGTKFFYSNTKDKGFFGIPKVIFGDGGINEPFIDMEGKYGMTQHAIGIVIKDKKEADKLKKFLQSNFFKNILSACMYSGFQIDWRLFTYFKRNFWDLDVNLDELIIQGSNDEQAQGGGKQRRFTRKVRRV